MKALILAVAILVGGYSASSNNNIVNEAIYISVADDFTEVAVDKLPEVITNAVKKDYANATIVKAYVNTENEYKLELKTKEVMNIVFSDKDGNWLKEIESKEIENE